MLDVTARRFGHGARVGLTEAMGGGLTVHSTRDAGTCVELTIPAARHRS